MDDPFKMFPKSLVIAARTMTRRAADGKDVKAVVEIGIPFEHPAPPGQRHGNWCCQVQTSGLGDDRLYTLFGFDSLQALCHAIDFGRTIVTNSRNSADLDWARMPNHGFPVVTPLPADAAAAAPAKPVGNQPDVDLRPIS